jgi:hypothetical protein
MMIKRLLFLVFVISLVAFAGCAKNASTDKKGVVQDTATPESTGSAIQDAGSVSAGIDDPSTNKQLDDINSSLSNW